MLAEQLSIDVSNGKPFLGKLATKQGKVLYVDYENRPHRIKSRGLDLGNESDLSNVFFIAYDRISDRTMGLEGDDLKRLKEAVQETQPSLLVIDPLRLATSKSMSDSDTVVVQTLSAVSELQTESPKTGIMLIHHLKKSQGDRGKLCSDPRDWVEQAYGSQALLAHVEMIIGLERHDDDVYTLATVPRSYEPIIWTLEKAVQSERFVLSKLDSQILKWPPALMGAWRKLPTEFTWTEGIAVVGNSTLDRVIKKARPLGYIVQDQRTKKYRKVSNS